ncbi:hypothetical protein MPSEU_000652400 [Mayamaea pseudoterrestris]|nr:hypothetical protein MPSEU_000652400 [Mayamaea pseudoterrestris]
MSVWLSQSSLMAPVPPAWLESICQRLTEDDPSLVTVELANLHRVDDNFSKLFARAFEHNTKCTTLILSFASIVDDGAFALGSVLSKHKHVTKLQLRDLRNHREIVILLDNMRTNNTITELSFRHCQLCPRSAQAIQHYLEWNPNVQEVRLVDCQLVHDQQASMQRLSIGFQHSPSLRNIYLLNMELEPVSANHIASMLTNPTTTLKELHLGENNLADQGAGILSAAVLSNHSLSLLDLRSNSISAQGALTLQGMVARSTSMLSLCLNHNDLGAAGATAIARGLQQSTSTLVKLQLSGNDIQCDGCKAMAHMLRLNKTLEVLDLSMNDILNDGAAAIARALTRNKTLRSINLRRNDISDQGALTFAQSLGCMRGLKELILNKNTMTELGGDALLDALQCNTEIEYLTATDDSRADRRMVPWFRLNKAGRRIFKDENVPSALWSKVYSKAASDANSLYFFVKARPEAMPVVTTNKRKSQPVEAPDDENVK